MKNKEPTGRQRYEVKIALMRSNDLWKQFFDDQNIIKKTYRPRKRILDQKPGSTYNPVTNRNDPF